MRLNNCWISGSLSALHPNQLCSRSLALVFVSKWVRQSRVFIPRILALPGKLRHNHHHATLTAEFRKDLVWWRRFLREYNGLTIVVALKLWGGRWTGLRITVRCDNDAAVTVVNTGRCRSPFMNSCLREICNFAALYEFEVCAVQVPGVSNHFADLLSRWDSLSAKEQFLQRVQRDHWQDVPVPDALFRFYGNF